MMMITDTEWLVMTNAASLQTDQSQEGKLALALSCNQATHHSAICMVIAILQRLNSQYCHCLIQRNLLSRQTEDCCDCWSSACCPGMSVSVHSHFH